MCSKRPLRVLLDSGSTSNFVYPQALPKAAKPCVLNAAVPVQTLNTVTSMNSMVTLDNVVFTEFSHSLHIDNIDCYVAHGTSKYDGIIGRRTMQQLGIKLDFDTDTVHWLDEAVAMRASLSEPRMSRFREFQRQFLDSYITDDENIQPQGLDCFMTSTEILEARYRKADIDEEANQQKHLNPSQCLELRNLLRKFTKLFSGKLGSYPHRKMHLDINPVDRKRLCYQRPYAMPQVNHDLFYKELQQLISLGALEEVDGLVDFAVPTFLVPKKDGTVRWVSNFRELNKVMCRKVYPLPHINRILCKQSKHSFFTKLDIGMQCYTFELDDSSEELCTISTPFGNYRYNRAPMGVKQTPDFAQQIMEQTLRGMREIEVCIDDVAVFGAVNGSFTDHMVVLEKVLQRLQDANFTINPLKCEWAVQETDFLGFWLTPQGLKPWKKKVKAILDLEAPRNVSETRSFIEAVTFYREMFPKRSHILAPLHRPTEAKSKNRFVWSTECDNAFKQIKAMLTKDAFIRYPDPNKPFHVYTDASDIQLGAVIVQEGKPVAYFSRKHNSTQRNCATMEKELLSIVTTLQEYQTMLYGVCELHVHADHKNLTYANLNSQRVLRWRLFLEEFNPTFHYIEGEANTLADALSRLPIKEGQSSGADTSSTTHTSPQRRRPRPTFRSSSMTRSCSTAS